MGSKVNNNYLYHHGIKGMKWGVRRFQNKDGELTPAGKDRHTKREQKRLKKAQKEWDRNYERNWYKAYNKAADYANEVLIPAINKKYAKYDFRNRDNDPEIKKIYEKYEQEYMDQFNEVYSMKLKEMFGDRPE